VVIPPKEYKFKGNHYHFKGEDWLIGIFRDFKTLAVISNC
jgi:hypothetical protein